MTMTMSAQSQRKRNMPLLFKPNEIPMVTSATRRVNMFAYPRPVRSTSPSSTDADYGDSDEDEVETMEEYAENLLEEKEVANWLMCSDPQPWTSPCVRAPTEAPFTLWTVPGPLFLQLIQFLLVYFGFVPRQNKFLMPVPHRMPSRRPLSILHYWDPVDREKQARYMGVTASPMEDEMTYVIIGTPRTDEEPERIRMTVDYSTENMETHKPGALRVYRFHKKNAVEFITHARSAELLWTYVRKPDHSFDTVAVYKHGYRSWDFGKDEMWALVSSREFMDTVRLRAVGDRAVKLPLSRKGRVKFGALRFINWIFRRLGITVQVGVPNLMY
ncbi:hypothetical protein CVT25_002611 [Psilocybe cyanescens]|uniref:Uncharacterized protein n=1 Tax=Psilocybe cyanescens TaxID=93625 RepID=A0A409WLS5_PSICY|nr:hypothetical protein CVT25_002611 [Psilocybe cyanescens]